MNVDTNEVVPVLNILKILGPVVQATLLSRSRQVCVGHDWVSRVSDNPNEGILRSLDGANVAR